MTRPREPIWPTPKEQLAALKRLFHSSPSEPAQVDEGGVDSDAEDVATALRGVDWGRGSRCRGQSATSDVTRTMRAMADHVDWAKVQPVAAQVSSALIAAVAAGRIPVGGHLGPIVARAITDQNNLGKRVAHNLQQSRNDRAHPNSAASSRQPPASEPLASARGRQPGIGTGELSTTDWPGDDSTVICRFQLPDSESEIVPV